ncbi:hypothetical protein L4D08_00095 [Photobacterium chitinilyticum]|uniref:hypothetical protein n=1 Tax=Photobacterium chitinilyticum TaxID=2485123 RepID=UPI003D0B8698
MWAHSIWLVYRAAILALVIMVVFSQIAGMLSRMKSYLNVENQNFSDLSALWFSDNHRHLVGRLVSGFGAARCLWFRCMSLELFQSHWVGSVL